MKLLGLVCAAVALAGIFLSAVFAEDVSRSLPSSELYRLLHTVGSKVTVVDVRSETDFAKEHIPGAINVLIGRALGGNVGRDAAIVVYCGNESCPKSLLAAKMFTDSSYSNVITLDGGLVGWKQSGYPTEGTAASGGATVAAAGTITAEELKIGLSSSAFHIVDLRTATEYAAAHIKGAVNVPYDSLSSASLPADKVIVVYDRSGATAAKAAAALKNRGMKVRQLSGGFAAWAGKKLPMASGGK